MHVCIEKSCDVSNKIIRYLSTFQYSTFDHTPENGEDKISYDHWQ